LRPGVGEGRAAGHVGQYDLAIENVEDFREGCAVRAFEAGSCQGYIPGWRMADSDDLGGGVVGCVGGDAVVDGARDEVLVDKLHIPLFDVLDGEAGDCEAWVRRRIRALFFWRCLL
jgi:hypothetical protein